jgi:hypothetical protein
MGRIPTKIEFLCKIYISPSGDDDDDDVLYEGSLYSRMM